MQLEPQPRPVEWPYAAALDTRQGIGDLTNLADEAIAIEANIFCVARSGRPDDPGPDSVTPAGVQPDDRLGVLKDHAVHCRGKGFFESCRKRASACHRDNFGVSAG